VERRCANNPPRDDPSTSEAMSAFYSAPNGLSSPAATRPGDLLRRRPQRVTITMPWMLRQRLERRADEEGRSLSGLIAYILERSSD
jgi:hypothetical protein